MSATFSSSSKLVFASELLSSDTSNRTSRNAPLSSLLLEPSNDFNKFALYCPNPNCRCLILRPVQAHGQVLATPQVLPALSVPIRPLPTDFPALWYEIPKKMTFENIGFSNPISASDAMRYLSCADCDIGPLGFTKNDISFLDANRVRYRQDLS